MHLCVRVRLFDDLSIRKCSGSRHAPECFGIFNPSRLVCSTKMVKLQAPKTARQISGLDFKGLIVKPVL